MPVWQLVAAGLVSLVLTHLFLTLARRRRILDTPNARSSHFRPTPKGGGLAFALAISAGLLWLSRGAAPPLAPPLGVLAFGGLLLSACGIVDDLRGLGPFPRLVLQIAVTAALVYSLPALPGLGYPLDLLPAALASLPLVLLLVWIANLYNFMDGIDGLACLQALLTCLTLVALDCFGLYPGNLGMAALLVAAAVAGFSVFNFPPARIFMGDAGSAYLGFVLGGLAVVDGAADEKALWLWLVLLGWFVSDASVTLVTRIVSGHRFYQAHRSHAYQLLARHLEQAYLAAGSGRDRARTRAHRICLAALAMIFVCWQLPVALLLATGRLAAPTAIALAYLPLIATAILAGAGGDRLLPYFSRRKKHSR